MELTDKEIHLLAQLSQHRGDLQPQLRGQELAHRGHDPLTKVHRDPVLDS